MSTNLVASAVKLLSPELISRIASMLGVDQATIEKAVSAGVPGILAAFTSLVSKPSGATRLADAVAQQQPGFLNSIASAGQAGQRDLIDSGVSSLSSLLGGGPLSSITDALGRYAGLSEGASKGILGLLGPMVMGVLGQQQRASGLDATGLAQLLQSQKGNIARAMPAGFAKQLENTGLLDQTTGITGRRPMGEDHARERSWLAPALAVLALGALAWYFLGRPHDGRVATAPSTEMTSQVGHPLMVTESEVSSWLGRPVYSSDNVKIGEIVEINRGPDNRVTDIIFDSGTAMGMGAVRHRALASQFQQVKPDSVTLTVKETEVSTVPSPRP